MKKTLFVALILFTLLSVSVGCNVSNLSAMLYLSKQGVGPQTSTNVPVSETHSQHHSSEKTVWQVQTVHTSSVTDLQVISETSTCPSSESLEMTTRPTSTAEATPKTTAQKSEQTTRPTTKQCTSSNTTTATTRTKAQTTTSTQEQTTARSTSSQPAPACYDSLETEVLALVNAERAKKNLAPLAMNASLRDSARIRAEEISRVWGHTRPNGSSYTTAIKIGFGCAAENIACGQQTAARVVECWMDSEGHKKNIMNPNYSYIGIGCYYNASEPYRFYWAQLFVGP